MLQNQKVRLLSSGGSHATGDFYEATQQEHSMRGAAASGSSVERMLIAGSSGGGSGFGQNRSMKEGRKFFKEVRERLKEEQFIEFMKTIKRLNDKKLEKGRALEIACGILG